MQREINYKIYDIMTTTPKTIKPNETIREAARVMAKYDVNSLIVVNDQNEVIGIITDEDIVRKVVINNFDADKIRVSDIMTKDPYTIDPEANLDLAVQMMKELHIRHLPVTKNNRLLGIVTAKDIIKIQPELFEIFKIRDDVELLHYDEPQVCEICGKKTTDLYIINNVLVCPECYESIRMDEVKFNPQNK